MQILSAQYVITSAKNPPLIDGALVIEKGKILDIGPKKQIFSHYAQAEVIDFGESILFPGLVNAHTHASMTIFRGLADDLPLMTWLENYIFPVERHLKPEWVYWGAKLAIAEMFRSGVTLFADMYLFEEEVIKAVEEAGVKATLGEGLFDFPSPNYGPLENGLALTEKLFKDFAEHSRIKIMACPHATYTCSPDTLKAVANIAERYDALIHIHLSETKDEVSLIKARYGKTPPFHLDSLGLLNERLLVAHAVQLTDEEIELLAKRQVKVAHCPESNLKLGSGVAPVPALLEAGVCVGLGTDGPASNNDLDLIGEMRTAALIQKGLTFDPTKLPAKDVFSMATSLGAEALGWPELGCLTKDGPADLAVIRLSSSHLTPCYDPISILVYSARAGDVTDVMVAGEFVMRDSRILTFDEDEAKQKVLEISQEIKALLGR
ncbi:amidohydrolase [Thermodesulfatator autotrophicus]|uniref:5-methylthioadenosine/S-adenosylhomocysteine deaminase n=1 Tax=Thermodesulfatator autotrophicus TaxID=1795632 RepID=A0A177E5E0_9BACT|nr:amidohydrolase [Thermodesulfatator autotrophicus]OAG27183.1 amidohydrolase [Thermodesulfatator autotrophicus]